MKAFLKITTHAGTVTATIVPKRNRFVVELKDDNGKDMSELFDFWIGEDTELLAKTELFIMLKMGGYKYTLVEDSGP